jgi:hypothetical protein
MKRKISPTPSDFAPQGICGPCLYNCIRRKVGVSTLQSRIVFEIPGVVLFFINKNSVLISVLAFQKRLEVTSKAACGILISVSIGIPYKISRHFLEFERHSILVGVVFLYLKVLL